MGEASSEGGFGFGEHADASQGFDLLGLALGRSAGPGATDLDEFVDIEIFFDGIAAAADPFSFLRARLCEVFELLWADLEKYLWHRDRFCLEIDLGDAQASSPSAPPAEPRLAGHIRTGDGAEDEWFVVYLLRRLTALCPDAACRVVDADGELLLIEAALAVPRWLTPDNAENRVWLRGGEVHILPKPRPPEPQRLPKAEALSRLRAGGNVAKGKVQDAIAARLDGYPRRGVDLSRHIARAVLPARAARLLIAFPQLVAVAVDHLPPPPAAELQRLRRQLRQDEAACNFSCEGLGDQDVVCVGLRFTKCQYARLLGLRCNLPQRFSAKHWRRPAGAAPDEPAEHLGALLAAGLDAAFLQGTQSATAVLRWPRPQGLLPKECPWFDDEAFVTQASSAQSQLKASSVAARRAFLQQSSIEEPFRRAMVSAWNSEAVAGAIDLREHWRDQNDDEGWLEVSAEDLDREMIARQAEFDAFDHRRGAGTEKSRSTAEAEVGAAAAAGGQDTRAAQEELARLGSQLSGFLARASGIEGVDAARGASTASGDGAAAATAPAERSRTGAAGPCASAARSDDSDDGDSESELDVLGMEEDFGGSSGEDSSGDEADGGGFRDYLAELDEQLEETLDAPLAADEASGARPTAGGLPLSSRHVKMHSGANGATAGGAIELDLHAMEHILASHCAEHSLAPGPASILLGELGLAARGFGSPAAAAHDALGVAATLGGPAGGLDAMD